MPPSQTFATPPNLCHPPTPPPHLCHPPKPLLTPKPSSDQPDRIAHLSDGSLALASKGESKAALGVAPLLNGDTQQLQVVDGVHVHVCEVGQALPLLLPGVIHLLRVGDHVAHQQPHLYEHNHDINNNKYNDDNDGDDDDDNGEP